MVSKVTYKSHVFATLTYERTKPISELWTSVSRDFNRYIQRVRRIHGHSVAYLRAIEAHKDNYPHVHVILQHSKVLAVNNGRYFDRDIYGKWRKAWTHGLSDYQVPRIKRYPIFYLLKYVQKDTHTLKTIYKKLFSCNDAITAKHHSMEENQDITENTANTVKNSSQSMKNASLSTLEKNNSTLFFCKKYNVKQCSWSRSFKFPQVATHQGDRDRQGSKRVSLLEYHSE
ncbi:hypothetical protein GWO13_04935 [Candidatus Bathyarchaeota archaeon]|nr:hypothetical protein [Candidatus Bathyarchaeota archaeon]